MMTVRGCGTSGCVGRLEDDGNSGFVHFDLHIVSHLEHEGCFLDVGNDAVNAAVGDDLVPGFHAGNERLMILLFLLLRTDEKEVKQHRNDDERGKLK